VQKETTNKPTEICWQCSH